jgi:hypothetical protein
MMASKRSVTIKAAWIGIIGVLIIAIVTLVVPFVEHWLNAQNDIQPKVPCSAYLESNGQVVINADQYIEQVPGRKYLPNEDNPSRDATSISWEKNNEFPNTLQALPDLQSTNTQANTNGPALVYLIDFHTTGKFYVYIRGFGVSTDSDSIHVGLGGIPVTTDLKNGFSLGSDKQAPRWFGKSADSGKSTFVEVQNPGLNTFYIWMRENGVNVQRIWLDTGSDKVLNNDITEGPPISLCVE